MSQSPDTAGRGEDEVVAAAAMVAHADSEVPEETLRRIKYRMPHHRDRQTGEMVVARWS
jgi:tellurite resistance protein